MSEKGKILPFLGIPVAWYRYQTGVVPVPLRQKKNGTGTNQSGTGATSKNKIGTGTNQSGTGTNASNSPKLYTDSIGTLVND